MSRLLRSIVMCAALALLCWAPALHAQSSATDTATARQLAVEAYEALDAKDFERAAELFTRAEKLHHAPTLLLGLARAQVGLGKYVEARENYIKVTREKIAPGASDAFVRAVRDARTEMAGLDSKIAWVMIRVSGPSEPEVTIDGAPVPVASLGVKRAVNPGPHEVSASAAGYAAQSTRFTAEAGGTHDVALELEPQEGASAAPTEPVGPAEPEGLPPPVPDGADQADPGGTQRVLGYVSLGLGGAGLVMGIITGVLAMGEHGELEDNCPNEVCPESQQGTIDAYDTTSTLSTVGFIAGGVLAATGIVLVLTAPSAEEQDPSVALRVGPTSLGATIRF